MITTHVLDTAAGHPGRGLTIELERGGAGGWVHVSSGVTDDDGRCRTLTSPGVLATGTYRLRFHTASPFFPVVEIQFAIVDGAQHYHVPLLLAPYGYSTYRGS